MNMNALFRLSMSPKDSPYESEGGFPHLTLCLAGACRCGRCGTSGVGRPHSWGERRRGDPERYATPDGSGTTGSAR